VVGYRCFWADLRQISFGGSSVVVINATKINVTGKKLTQKMYYRHSQYPGGLKSTSLGRMMETHPTRVIEHAVKGMLPHNRLGAAMLRKLKVYPGAEHPHNAQVKGIDKES
jgi:large subunit ribosomal protein L13